MADVTWSGSASLGYNDGHQDGLQDGINGDIDLDVTLSNAGGYTATVTANIDTTAADNLVIGEDIDITTPVASIHFGEVVEAANSAYSDVDGMAGLGSDEFTAQGSAILISASAGGMTVAYSDDSAMEGGDDSSFGLSGAVGGVSFGIGSKGDDWGISASGSALGGTISIASEEVGGNSETGAAVTVPLGDMSVTVSATDGDDWGASVSTSLAGATISAGTDDDEDNQFSLSTAIAGGFNLAVDFDTSDGSAVGLTYSLSDSATLSVSYYEDLPGTDDGPQTSGTEAKLAFTF
ncbi:MAG: hypothetical protein CML40_06385 [Rhodobacteraceae bacterium]|jgi:hypothetical protein|nr:MAG: hypothetical protein CML40_06385 [Paracoccaceae bacterium]